jgi:chaperone LolA
MTLRVSVSLALASLAVSLAPSLAAAEPSAPAPALVAKVQAFFGGTSSFESDFEQQYTIQIHHTVRRSRGHVTFAKPGRMNWVYAAPPGTRMVSDGKTFTSYDSTDQQLTRVGFADTPLADQFSWLTGQADLAKAFSFELLKDEPSAPNDVRLLARPKSPNAAYTKLVFYVDRASAAVERVIIVDAQNNQNQFTFRNVKRNGAVDAKQFEWKGPQP